MTDYYVCINGVTKTFLSNQHKCHTFLLKFKFNISHLLLHSICCPSRSEIQSFGLHGRPPPRFQILLSFGDECLDPQRHRRTLAVQVTVRMLQLSNPENMWNRSPTCSWGPDTGLCSKIRVQCLKSEPLCVSGGAAVFQAAPVLRPAGGGPLLPQLRARGGHGARQPLGGLPEDRHTSSQQQPAGVTWAGSRDFWKHEEGALEMTGQHERMD